MSRDYLDRYFRQSGKVYKMAGTAAYNLLTVEIPFPSSKKNNGGDRGN